MRHFVVGVLLWTLFVQPVFGNGLCARPEALIGSKARSEAQVHRVKDSDASFFENDTVITLLAESGALVRINDGPGYWLDGIGTSRFGCSNYPENIRVMLSYARLEVAEFLAYFGTRFESEFPSRAFKVTALARTKWWQNVLHKCGLSAVTASPHQWGFALDISKRDLAPEEVCWLWGTLIPLQEAGFLTAVDEARANNIHITVHSEFLLWREKQRALLELLSLLAF